MTEIEFTLPTAQYANVKVRATPEELGLHGVDNAYELGVAAAVYLNLFTQGYKVGGAMDVVAPSGPLKAPLAASQPEVDRPVDPVDKAAQIVAEGLGGATEVDSTEEISDDGQNSDEMPGGIAPWEQDLARKSKPWEAEATAPKAVVTEDW